MNPNNKISEKKMKFVGIFHKLQHNRCPDALRTLYNSFIHPRILYGVDIYANTCKSFLKGPMVLNNKILSILQHHSYEAHTAELHKNYNTLDIPGPGLHNYQLCILVHKFLFGLITCYLLYLKIILHKTVHKTKL